MNAKNAQARVAETGFDVEQNGDVTSSAGRQWPVMDEAAFYGLLGDVVKTIAPHTEADPAAILIQVLIMFGNVIGRSPYYQVEADQHRANLFCVLVGQSAKGRKGTSGSRARSIMQVADEAWLNERLKGGLSSGEGLIAEVRDEVEQWNAKTQQFDVIDPGVPDKRLMVTEAEFGGALAVMDRPGNTLSSVVRQAWDGEKLSTLTRNSPLRSTEPHISVIGHITEDELRARIDRTEAANGFANRFLFVAVRRSKCLPHGGSLDQAETLVLAERMKEVVNFARRVGRVEMTEAARQLWESIYPHLSGEQPGLLGAVTARAEAQAIRLAMVYALLDRQDRIDAQHLKAALAVWEYCDASAARVFGTLLGDPVADEILMALRKAGSVGMTRTLIRDLLGKHKTADRINAALALLACKGLARWSSASTGGRPAETWYSTGA